MSFISCSELSIIACSSGVSPRSAGGRPPTEVVVFVTVTGSSGKSPPEISASLPNQPTMSLRSSLPLITPLTRASARSLAKSGSVGASFSASDCARAVRSPIDKPLSFSISMSFLHSIFYLYLYQGLFATYQYYQSHRYLYLY